MGGRPKLLTRAPTTERLMPRHRLTDASRTAPLTLFVAPAGSGATTAAAQTARATGTAIAWCRLATGFAAAADVVSMVAEAGGVPLEPADRLLDLADQLLEVLEATPLVVVVDDHHVAQDDSVDRLIAECIDLVPPSARFLVTSHVRPAGLIGLVPAPNRTIIDGATLAFTLDEAQELFELHGGSTERAATWHQALGGSVEALAAGAHDQLADPTEHLAQHLQQAQGASQSAQAILGAAAVLPYVSVPLLRHLGLDIDAGDLGEVAASTATMSTHGDLHRLSETARQLLAAPMEPDKRVRLLTNAAAFVSDDDPTTAIDLLLEAGDHEAAADVLADHLSEIGVERALNWLYRLPPELRRRFPPVLAAGQATVEVDAALALAEARVESATTQRSRREALFALGSVEVHRGELTAAAGAFEAAMREARNDPPSARRIAAELAGTRWLVGDAIGALAALRESEGGPAMRWLAAQLRSAGHTDAIESEQDPSSDTAFDFAAAALDALVAGDVASSNRAAEAAYADSVDGGGDSFVAAAAVRAWSMLVAGRFDEASLLADELERRLGPRHQLARVHGAIIRERCSREAGDRSRHERDQRRLRDLRAFGYASIQMVADRVLDGERSEPAGPATNSGVAVSVLGTHTAHVGGRTIRRSDWTSKKAFEVLTVLASHSPAAVRREQVIEAVWPGRDPAKGRTLLRTSLSEIRRVLQPDRPAGEASAYVITTEDTITVSGSLDLNTADDFLQLEPGLAPEVAETEWAAGWVPVFDAALFRAATNAAIDSQWDLAVRTRAFETLVAAEPWQRAHYDGLAALYRDSGNEASATEVERRWFADD